MKHFIGGFSAGLLAALVLIQHPKRATLMGNWEFCAYIGAHLFFASLVGFAAWGLLP